MPVPGLAFGEDGSGGYIKRGKQRGGPMANVIMGDPLHVTEPHGQHRLGTVQSLNLALLIHAKHQRVVRRIEVKPCDIAYFLHKERIGGEFEAASTVRLNGERTKQAV